MQRRMKGIKASGISGHGFKFVSVTGEIPGDLVIKGKTDNRIEFLRWKRFKQS